MSDYSPRPRVGKPTAGTLPLESGAEFVVSACDQLDAEVVNAARSVAALQRGAFTSTEAQATYKELLAQLDLMRALARSITRAVGERGAVGETLDAGAVRIAARLGRHFDETEMSPAQSAHWARLYEDLAALERDMLARTRGDGAAPHEPLVDTQLLEASVARLEERSRHWRSLEWSRQGVARDDETRTLRWHDRELRLTRREYALVTTLMDNPGRKLPARQLVHRAWGSTALSTEQLRTYVARLRASAAQAGIPINIVTDRGRGYSIELLAEAALPGRTADALS